MGLRFLKPLGLILAIFFLAAILLRGERIHRLYYLGSAGPQFGWAAVLAIFHDAGASEKRLLLCLH